jgi:hypothetical protein
MTHFFHASTSTRDKLCVETANAHRRCREPTPSGSTDLRLSGVERDEARAALHWTVKSGVPSHRVKSELLPPIISQGFERLVRSRSRAVGIEEDNRAFWKAKPTLIPPRSSAKPPIRIGLSEVTDVLPVCLRYMTRWHVSVSFKDARACHAASLQFFPAFAQAWSDFRQ